MWELDQNLDQPMDEEASQLKNMYREKVSFWSLHPRVAIIVSSLLVSLYIWKKHGGPSMWNWEH
jgi:hypothetical protein